MDVGSAHGRGLDVLPDPVARRRGQGGRTRIDLVRTSENWPVAGVVGTSDRPFRAPTAAVEFGVTARIVIPQR
jgi:hypothetical protein